MFTAGAFSSGVGRNDFGTEPFDSLAIPPVGDESDEPEHSIAQAFFEEEDVDSSAVNQAAATSSQHLNRPFIPPRPSSSATDAESRAAWNLALEDAIEIALSRNADLNVERLTPNISSWRIDVQDSIFDPVFSLGGEWARSEDQVTNFADGPGIDVTSATTDYFRGPQGLGDQLRLSKKLRSGGEMKAEFSSNYAFSEPGGEFLVLNPAIRSDLRLQVGHNLWRGVGRDLNMIDVEIAHHVHSNAHRRLEAEMRQTVLETATAYWSLLGARENLVLRQEGVDEAYAIWVQEIDKQKLGASAGPDVAEAREQLERFRVTYVEVEKEVADAERQLRDLLGVPLEDMRFVEPTSQPTTHSPFLDWENAVVEAMESRPELHLQKSEVEMAKLRRCEAADRLRPDLSGYAGWGLSGAADQFGDTLETIHDGDYASWWLGIRYEHKFGRRQDKALLEQAQLNVQQRAAQVNQITRIIHRELHDAFQSVENAWRVIEASREQLEAAETVLEARREMYDLGESRLEDKLRALSAWGRAASVERRAVADYNRALTAWEYAKGSILEYTQIRFQPTMSDSDRVR